MTADSPPAATTRVEPFATSVRRGVPMVWATGSDADLTALLGWGERFRVEARGRDRFQQLHERFTTWASTQPDSPTAFVTVAFADDSGATSTLIAPEVLGRWNAGALTTDGPIPDPADPGEPCELDLQPGRLTRERYRRAVTTALDRIARGHVEKVVLARDLEARAPDRIDLPGLIARLQRANPTSWTFHVDGLVGSSPEMLVAVRGTSVRSQALAGSGPVTGDPDADDATEALITGSTKDRAEHAYAARSVAERLARVAHVTMGDPHMVRLPRIMHLATDISGRLREPRTALEVAALVHPSAAVCGTPTERAARVIAELEGFDRGRYAGPVGWVDAAGDGEFAIALRCGQLSDDGAGLRLFAGGGIVAGSVPSEELAETAAKFLPMYEALSPGARP